MKLKYVFQLVFVLWAGYVTYAVLPTSPPVVNAATSFSLGTHKNCVYVDWSHDNYKVDHERVYDKDKDIYFWVNEGTSACPSGQAVVGFAFRRDMESDGKYRGIAYRLKCCNI